MESKGVFSVSVYNRTTEVTDKFAAGTSQRKAHRSYTFQSKNSLRAWPRPRKVMIMVKAGAAVDAVIDQLLAVFRKKETSLSMAATSPLLRHSASRQSLDCSKAFHFPRHGVSGGEEGATQRAVDDARRVQGTLGKLWHQFSKRFSAQVEGEPCCRYIGARPAQDIT